MPEILILGAGRSAGYLIDYLLEWSNDQFFTIRIADQSVEHLLHYKTNKEDMFKTFLKLFKLETIKNDKILQEMLNR
jgi:saccharopine dehydrogenase-like NADP-dependent oxidoreductase